MSAEARRGVWALTLGVIYGVALIVVATFLTVLAFVMPALVFLALVAVCILAAILVAVIVGRRRMSRDLETATARLDATIRRGEGFPLSRAR